MRKLHFDDYVILSYSSLAVHLLAQLKKTIVFYDCADDHAAWKRSNRNRRQIEHDEPLLAKKAAAIFVVSKILKEKFSLINENTFLIPNGVEIEHFKKSRQNPLLPQDMLGIKGPIIGFIGVVSDLFDLGLLEAAARIKPEWSFVIVGPITSNIIKPDLKNIHFLGKKSYEELPSYLTTFDVCTIPLNRSPAALGANPAKLFQYLAGGKPVVSVDLPEVETFSDLIYISKNEKEFIDNIDVALKEANPKIRQKRIIEARRNTWDQRVEMMVNIISRFEGQRTAKPLKKNLV
ncbi:MAG: glycosyltransferase [Actinomycetia bacterium]|nr:glycosyltransferase [Actinomycetes bacterium]